MTATRLAPQASRGPQVHADPWPEEHPSAAALRALPDAAPVAFWVDHLPPRDSEPPLSGLVEADLCVVRDGFTGFWAALAAKKDDPQQEVVLLEAGRDSVATRTRFVNTRPTPFPRNRCRRQ